MIAVAWWQGLLYGLGWVLARLYDFIPNYGVAIILLTVGIRLVLLPLGVKQIRSMQATAALQPKMKQLQAKHKGDRQKLNEEMMKLYREHGYNPLSGCFPLLAQLPVLIALFSVLRFTGGHVQHIPTDSRLYSAIVHQDASFAGANLLCSAVEAGRQVDIAPVKGQQQQITHLDCGSGVPSHVPYYVMALMMLGTTFYQQRQMQKNSPAGGSPQQQTLMRVMPLLFGFWGFIFPAGLVVYWTTTNLIQIGQQQFLFKRGAPPAPVAKDGKADGAGKGKVGRTASFRERRPTGGAQKGSARSARPRPQGQGRGAPRSGSGGATGSRRAPGPSAGDGGRSQGNGGRGRGAGGSKRSSGGSVPNDGTSSDRSGRANGGTAGGRDAGDRKKRGKR